MKYLIFGGNGFVGRYLANKLLGQGNKVLVLDKLSLEQSRVYRSPLYFGFVRDNGLERYFRLVDFRNGRKIDFPPLDSYNEILDNLMAPPFDAYLEDCK